jgi:tetratricopeptide (TPR) repeat protein
MQFDPDNNIIKLCAEGMKNEAEGNAAEAARLFYQAWDDATNDFEKFTAAHYVARHQNTVADKLKWDKTALSLALQLDDEKLKASYPSLYLNIAKCYEDLKDLDNAKKNYEVALSYTNLLPDDGYGRMIKSGIISGIDRITNNLG